jgi:hypothetical protein
MLVLPVILSGLVAYFLIVVGLSQIGLALIALLLEPTHEKEVVAKIFLGLDLLFISPMAVMILYALYLLADSLVSPEQPEEYENARRKLLDAKVFVLGLLSTAVAVHWVEGILTGHMDPQSSALCAVTILVVGGYGVLLERVGHR